MKGSTELARGNSTSAGLRRRLAAGLVPITLGAVVVTAAVWPSKRFIGVNYVVSEESVPLWIKAVDFVDRDLNLARKARAVVADADRAEDRVFAVLRWMEANVRPQSSELPVVDDHVWHVIIRGYGQADQHADVFTTLLAYADVPAFWQLIGNGAGDLPISYVLIDGRWRVFDVAHRVVFRTHAEALATPEDVAQDSELVRRNAALRVENVDEYVSYFQNYQPPEPPEVLRADLQMAGRRLAFEMKKLAGKQGRVWQIREDRR